MSSDYSPERKSSANRALRYASLFAAVAFFFLAAWSALWMLSSYDMAFTQCAGNYALFAEVARCRQPALALVLCLVSLCVAVGILVASQKHTS